MLAAIRAHKFYLSSLTFIWMLLMLDKAYDCRAPHIILYIFDILGNCRKVLKQTDVIKEEVIKNRVLRCSKV